MAVVACWFTASAGVWAWTVTYGTTTAQTPQRTLADPAPIVQRLTPSSRRPTLYLFMHPRCPCTRATIVELDRVLTSINVESLPEVVVIATIPSTVSDNDAAWRDSNSVRQAKQLPNASVVYDRGGAIAQSFGASASGSVAFYAANGQQLFSGGVTVSRGHEGANLGADNLRSRLMNPEQPTPVTAPALGCLLCLED